MLVKVETPEDVAAELADERFKTLSHYASATYDLGCRGPLCKMLKRDKMRRISQKRAESAGRVYKPAYKLRETLVPDNRDELLYQIVIAHRDERKAHRKQKVA